MKTYRIAFVTTCPVCGHSKQNTYPHLAESHVDWIRRMKNIYPGWHCDHCQRTVDAELRGVTAEEE